MNASNNLFGPSFTAAVALLLSLACHTTKRYEELL